MSVIRTSIVGEEFAVKDTNIDKVRNGNKILKQCNISQTNLFYKNKKVWYKNSLRLSKLYTHCMQYNVVSVLSTFMFVLLISN